LISLHELSNLTGIPYTTVARYTKEFMLYFSRKKVGRKLLFLESEAVETAKRVSRLYSEGNTTDQIHEILEREKTATIDVKPKDDEIQKGVISHMKNIILKQQERITKLEDEIHEIKQQNEKDKSEILQGVNDAMLEFMKMMKDNK